MRLFRQTVINNWEMVFEKIAAAVAQAMLRNYQRRTDEFLVEEAVDGLAELRVRLETTADGHARRSLAADLDDSWAIYRNVYDAHEELAELYTELQEIHSAMRAGESQLASLPPDAADDGELLDWARSMRDYQRRRSALKERIHSLVESNGS